MNKEYVDSYEDVKERFEGEMYHKETINYQGKEVDPDVFVYHLTVKCLDNREYYTQGNVTVIR